MRRTKGIEGTRRTLLFDACIRYMRSIELTQRAAPAVLRTGRDLLGTPTGCVRLEHQTTHVGFRAHTHTARDTTTSIHLIYMHERERRGEGTRDASSKVSRRPTHHKLLNEPYVPRRARQALGRDVMLGQYMVGAAFTGPHEFMLIVVYEGERKKKGFNLTQGTT